MDPQWTRQSCIPAARWGTVGVGGIASSGDRAVEPGAGTWGLLSEARVGVGWGHLPDYKDFFQT